MSYSIMKEQARRVARKAAVRYWDWRERPGCVEGGGRGRGREMSAAVLSIPPVHPPPPSPSLSSLSPSPTLTARVALADQLVRQDGDAQEVDGLRHDEQVVVVLHDQPEQAEEL
jgi:hypothetical protein